MGENKPRQGSKNWFDANPNVTEVDIYGKNKKAIHYMNGYIVTNHEEVTKEIIQKLSFTIGDKPYNAFLQTLSADEKVKRGIKVKKDKKDQVIGKRGPFGKSKTETEVEKSKEKETKRQSQSLDKVEKESKEFSGSH